MVITLVCQLLLSLTTLPFPGKTVPGRNTTISTVTHLLLTTTIGHAVCACFLDNNYYGLTNIHYTIMSPYIYGIYLQLIMIIHVLLLLAVYVLAVINK